MARLNAHFPLNDHLRTECWQYFLIFSRRTTSATYYGNVRGWLQSEAIHVSINKAYFALFHCGHWRLYLSTWGSLCLSASAPNWGVVNELNTPSLIIESQFNVHIERAFVLLSLQRFFQLSGSSSVHVKANWPISFFLSWQLTNFLSFSFFAMDSV